MIPTDPSRAHSALEHDQARFRDSLARVNAYIAARSDELHEASSQLQAISTPELINAAFAKLPKTLPDVGMGIEATTSLLLNSICPALAPGQAGPRFFGLVTGGVLPAAQLADQLVTSYDANVQIHNVEDSISSSLSHLTLEYLLSLLSLPQNRFTHNSFTTGATASNILGLALGRDHVVSAVKRSQGHEGWSVPEDGMGGVEVDVFVAVAHASIAKAASIVGLGRRALVNLVDDSSEMPCDFRMDELERRMKDNVQKGRGSIVVHSAGEVNTGGWTSEGARIRALCDEYDGWLHVDAAFGAFATLLPEFAHYAADLVKADSITVDAHKWLNVPYDCAFFLSRTSGLYSLCGPGGNAPAYLASSTATEGSSSHYEALDKYREVKSPLFMGIENSGRLRALPVYASLISLGRTGFVDLFARNVAFARLVSIYLRSHSSYEVLTPLPSGLSTSSGFKQMNIVLFAPASSAPARYQGEGGASALLKAINDSGKMYCTPTTWRGRRAVRMAVSNWRTEPEEDGRDWTIVRAVLEGVME